MHAGSATDELSLAIAGLLFASMGGLSLLMARRRRD
jgi:LPXTG-motif cell wall-anchored protein